MPKMPRDCQWCKRVFGEKECAPGMEKYTTTGICPTCCGLCGKPNKETGKDTEMLYCPACAVQLGTNRRRSDAPPEKPKSVQRIDAARKAAWPRWRINIRDQRSYCWKEEPAWYYSPAQIHTAAEIVVAEVGARNVRIAFKAGEKSAWQYVPFEEFTLEGRAPEKEAP